MTIQSIRFGQAKFDVGRGLSHGLCGRCMKDKVSKAKADKQDFEEQLAALAGRSPVCVRG